MFGDFDKYSLKELYDVYLKATYNLEIGGKKFTKGETIAKFDKITIAAIQAIRNVTNATGGYKNRVQVTWGDIKEVVFNFAQGTFSNTHFGLMTNSRILRVEKEDTKAVRIPYEEKLESDETGQITLKHKPLDNTLFIYDEKFNKILDYQIEEEKIKNLEPYTNYVIRYDYCYTNGANIVVLGRELITGDLMLEGKTRLKEDETGRVVTGLVTVPRIKLMSDLSIRLGSEANPVVANFLMTGLPTGNRRNPEIFDLVVLNDDIDADF